MNIKCLILCFGILFSCTLFADGYLPSMTSQDQPWSLTASFGDGRYQDVYSRDGHTALGRLALGNELMLSGDLAFGLELGVQNGNRMRLDIDQDTLTALQWLPVKTTVSPMLDLLVTAKSDPIGTSAFFAQLKGGLAFRSWQIELLPHNEFSQLAGEIQAGFGYPITALASLNLLYQGVFGSDPNLKINTLARSAKVSNIPSLHGLLLGLSVNL